MKRFVLHLILLASSLSLCQCVSTQVRRQVAPVVSPETGKPIAFTAKKADGAVKGSDVLAAMERMQVQLQLDHKNKRDPLSRLLPPLPTENSPAALFIGGPCIEVKTKTGRDIHLLLPLVTVLTSPTTDQQQITKAMPDIQAYSFRVLSQHMRPVNPDELAKQKPVP